MGAWAGLLPSAVASREFRREYELCRVIGKGSFGEVWRCRDRRTGEELAAKLVDTARQSAEERRDVEREVAILEALRGRHAGVVHLREALAEEGGLRVLIMELCRGGDLFELLKDKGALPEESARRVFRQLASAVAFCHSHGVVHRDIKPENILLDRPATELYEACLGGVAGGPSPPVHAKLADFGLAVAVGPAPDAVTAGYTGSKYYTAPEMLLGVPYGRGADVWSLGVVLCTMLTGRLPFAGHDRQDIKGLRRAILRGRIDFEQRAWEPVSDAAKHLVVRMLTVDPGSRIKAEEILVHPWLGPAAMPKEAELRLRLPQQQPELVPRAGFLSQSLPASPAGSHFQEALRAGSHRSYGSDGACAVAGLRLEPKLPTALGQKLPTALESQEAASMEGAASSTIPQDATAQCSVRCCEMWAGRGATEAGDRVLEDCETREPLCCAVPFRLDGNPVAWCFPQLLPPGWGGKVSALPRGASKEESVIASWVQRRAQAVGPVPALQLGKSHCCVAPMKEFFVT